MSGRVAEDKKRSATEEKRREKQEGGRKGGDDGGRALKDETNNTALRRTALSASASDATAGAERGTAACGALETGTLVPCRPLRLWWGRHAEMKGPAGSVRGLGLAGVIFRGLVRQKGTMNGRLQQASLAYRVWFFFCSGSTVRCLFAWCK